MKATITNNSSANQGVWTDDGLEFIAPGETRTLTIAKDHVERTKRLPFLTVEKPGKTDPLDHDGDGKKGGAHPPVDPPAA